MYNGIINVYKEKGYTSSDVVAVMRGILGQRKVGHTGTLDPEAEGVLPVCAGAGTKLVEELTDHIKEYSAVMKLGVETDTQDLTGKVTGTHEIDITEPELRHVILSFKGEYDQIPPMYSALKVNGQKLCDLARKGKTVERKPRRIKIYDIEIKSVDMPYVSFDVTCSKGTYIRTLCSDIGDKAGCGASMSSLVRTRVGDFKIEDAHKLAELQKIAEQGHLESVVIPVERYYENLPAVVIGDEMRERLINGNSFGADAIEYMMSGCVKCKIREEELSSLKKDEQEEDQKAADIVAGAGQKVRVYNAQNFFYGIYEFGEDGIYHPDKMMLCESCGLQK